jgi:cellulose synthase (UDP-forming)
MDVGERRRAPRAARMIPESRGGWWWRHERAVQVLAAAALVAGACYLTWRVGWSGRGANLPLYVALLAAEGFGWCSLAFYAVLAWSVPQGAHPPRVGSRHVDVFVCTFDEPVHVLEPTLVGCRAISAPHTTSLLDDGHRPEMAELARRLGARYVSRDDNAHAKAGNINHALTVTDGELILVLDADHVPLPHILDATVGYFEDPSVALVQTPHDFSNRDSVQHTKQQRHEQSLFYRVIAPAKDRHNAMFWCGSATLLRRQALLDVGGVLTDTVAEDFHTTIAMHARGWRTRYHDETLVQGRAPHDLAAFLLQRARWARGNLGVFRTRENPLTCRGLTASQRVSYFGSLFNYFSGLQRLTLLLVLVATLVSGQLPMHASLVVLLALWLPWSVLAFGGTLALSRGTLGPLDSTRYGLVTMGINLRGIGAMIFRSSGAFKVTPKEGVDEGGWRVLRLLGLCTATALALVVALLLRLLAVTGALRLPSM